jgi:hypothetical protein
MLLRHDIEFVSGAALFGAIAGSVLGFVAGGPPFLWMGAPAGTLAAIALARLWHRPTPQMIPPVLPIAYDYDPFVNASPEAQEHIRRICMDAAAPPDAASYVASLSRVAAYESRNQEGEITERCEELHFDLGWYYHELPDHVAIDVGGTVLMMHPGCLAALKGKLLVLEDRAVGYPDPLSRIRAMLIAR